MFNHLKHLANVFFCETPKGEHFQDRQIADDAEEVEVIVSGRGTITMPTGEITISAGDMLWYQPGQWIIAESDSEKPYATMVISFCVTGPSKEQPPMYSHWLSVKEARQFSDKVLEIFKQDSQNDTAAATYIYSRFFWEAQQHRQQQQHNRLPLPLRKARAYIEQHFCQAIEVHNIAQNADISSAHLHLLFRTHLNSSPMQEVIRQRIALAQNLLQTTSLSVKQTCYRCGFHDIKYFCARFKNETTLTPTQYRSKHSIIL